MLIHSRLQRLVLLGSSTDTDKLEDLGVIENIGELAFRGGGVPMRRENFIWYICNRMINFAHSMFKDCSKSPLVDKVYPSLA